MKMAMGQIPQYRIADVKIDIFSVISDIKSYSEYTTIFELLST